ncbi:MAG: DUF2848 family protein [Candidatus Aerophobetes bacterium]|nr:DUF2848 family protein [Candidatus Aerophobetes bacterium]
MKILNLNVISKGRSIPWQFKVKRMINAGYVGRNLEEVKAHIEELKRYEIPPPSSVPMIFPILSHNITTESRIEVIGSKTSGEVEYVLLLSRENVFVGVGSDHTDRDLESQSIIKSKQICQNVISRDIWKYEDVKSSWDDLLIQSWVKASDKDEEILYQKASLGTIISAAEIMNLVKSKIIDGEEDGLVIFSGTIPTVTNEIIHGSYFRSELIDSRLKRSLTCEYQIKKLDYLKRGDKSE